MFKSLFSEVHFHTTFFLSGLVQWHTILDIRTRSKRGGTYIALSYQIHTPGNFLLLMTLEFPEHQKVLLLNTHRNIPVWDSWDCPGPESSQHLVLLPSFSRQFQVVPADLGSSRNPGSSDSLIFYFLGEYSNHWLTLYFLSYLAHTWKERLQTPLRGRTVLQEMLCDALYEGSNLRYIYRVCTFYQVVGSLCWLQHLKIQQDSI